jgi:histidine triad (HIT) family protein
MQHLTAVAHHIAKVQQDVFSPEKVGLMIAGLEVPHVHLHVVPIRGVHDLDFANAQTEPDPTDLDRAASAIREGLRAAGHAEVPATD